ncbi:AAA family ATPase, partial [Gluconobacter cerinus]
AGWSSPVARQAHNLKAVGSNPTPATTSIINLYKSTADVDVPASFQSPTRVSAVEKGGVLEGADVSHEVQPLHLVLVEEPEAHLHAQVQQVFINKAYNLLRKHCDLGDEDAFCTQLIVSTHSSHVAHEADFANLGISAGGPRLAGGRLPRQQSQISPISSATAMTRNAL